MIKMLAIICLSVACSAATTVFLMMRYANISPQKVFVAGNNAKNVSKSEPANNDYFAKVIDIEFADTNNAANAAPPAVVVSADVSSQPAYFDYEKLNRDMSQMSDAITKFNQFLSDEIGRIRSSDQGTQSSPTNNIKK